MIDADQQRSRTLAPLVARYGLSAVQTAQLASLLAVLETDPRAPTSDYAAAHALDVHLADSLVALALEPVRTASLVADIGAGAGFPGLVLAAALPQGEVRLVESNARKCAFVEAVIAQVGLANARVEWTRAESWQEGFGRHDLVTARALASQPVVLEYAAPLLRVGGTLVDWRGRRDAEDERAALTAAAELGLTRVEIAAAQPYDGVRDHYLHVFVKAAATPARFPRRVGMARKRPLG